MKLCWTITCLVIVATIHAQGRELSLDKRVLDLLEDLQRQTIDVEDQKRLVSPYRADPAPQFQKRALADGSDCSAICGAQKHLTAADVCRNESWAPEYETKNGCQCLKGYKCCPAVCPDVDKETCNKENDQGKGKGYTFGLIEKDCCDCSVMKCLSCPAPKTKKQLGCNTKKGCFTYIKENHTLAAGQLEGECFESYCKETSPQYETPKCKNCQKLKYVKDDCNKDKPVCKGIKPFKKTCLNTRKPSKSSPKRCYLDPVKKEENIYYSEGQRCKKCFAWDQVHKECTVENSIAAAKSCAGNKVLDKVCWSKLVRKDDCKCDLAECTPHVEKPRHKFGVDEKCPKSSKKVEGFSICDMDRDICVPCDPDYKNKSPPCEYGNIDEDTDVNGCKTLRCISISFPQSCTSFKLTVDSKGRKSFTCTETTLLEVKAGSGVDVWAAVQGIENWAARTKDKNIQIKYSKNNVDLANYIFDGSNTNSVNWFVKARLLRVITGPDISQGKKNFFSAKGDFRHSRLFFVNANYGGCGNDAGWLVVKPKRDPCTNWFPGVAQKYPLMAVAKGTGKKRYAVSSDWTFADSMTITAVSKSIV